MAVVIAVNIIIHSFFVSSAFVNPSGLSGPWPLVTDSLRMLSTLRPAKSNEDPAKTNKLGKIYLEALAMKLNPEPVHLDPRQVGVSKANRLFSIKHVHHTILDSCAKDGHDPNRSQPGVCCETTKADQKELVRHNMEIANASAMMPQPDPELMRYEGLAGNHYNVALRCGKDGMQSPAGDLSALKASDASFNQACETGHQWIVLPSGLPYDLKESIATWRNQDQNENQTLTDGELVRLGKIVVESLLAKSQGSSVSLHLNQVVTATCLKSTLRLNPNTVGGYCRFVCQMYEEKSLHLVDEFLTEWSAKVDSKELAIPSSFFDGICKCEALKNKPLMRLYMSMSMYTKEGSTPAPRPQPDKCGFFNVGDLNSLSKHKWLVDLAENTLQRMVDLRKLLDGYMPHWEVLALVHGAGDLLMRTLFSKSLSNSPAQTWGSMPFNTGKLTQAKVNQILGFWAKYIDSKFPAVDFGEKSGLKEYIVPDTGDLGDVYMVGAGAPKPSDTDSVPNADFPVGCQVVSIKRFTLSVPVKGKPDFRRDVTVGTEAEVIEAEPARVRIKLDLLHKEAMVSTTGWANTKCLKRVVMTEPARGSGSGQTEASAAVPEVITAAHTTDHTCVWLKDWAPLLEGYDDAANLFFLKARANVLLAEVMQLVPDYEEGKDLGIIHRFNHMGACRSEIWTLKDFERGQLMFAPFTTEMKDRLYTTSASASLQHKRDMVPQNRVLAVDGRGRGHLSHADEHKHVPLAKGSLFWVCDRTAETGNANMFLEFCFVTGELNVAIPGFEKAVVKWKKDAIPGIPLLMNKTIVKKHTKLVALDDPVLARIREEDLQEKKKKDSGEGPAVKKLKS